MVKKINKTSTLIVRVTPQIMDILRLIAERDNSSVGAVVRRAIGILVKKEAKGGSNGKL